MLANNIQTSFIDRIARTHGEPPKDTTWADDLALKLEGQNPTLDQLQAAADGLVVSIKSKSFPPFSTCLKAIRDATTKPATQAAAKAEGVNATNYFTECQKWKGKHPGSDFLVISWKDDAAAWETWVAYFRQIGLHSNANLMSQPREAWTVPTLYPDMFDRRAPVPFTDRQVAEVRNTKRQRTADEIERTKRTMEDFRRDTPLRRQKERVQRQHIDSGAFDRWAEEQASAPMPSPSDALSNRLQEKAA